MKIVFMGTPDFAVPSLDRLIESGFQIVAVITAPDKPAGRGQKMLESAVKKYTVQQGLKILQPERLKDADFLRELKFLQADLQVVVAFRMLPEVVWQMPPKGTINLHASLLPQYRGAAPINWAIINGEKESGLTTFFLKHEIDTGPVLFTKRVAIPDTYTAGELHDELMQIGALVLLETVQAIERGDYQEKSQETILTRNALKHAPKIFKQDCEIDWHASAQTIYNRIRGLSPYPAAYTRMKDQMLKIFQAKIDPEKPNIAPGQWITDGKSELKFACSDGFISITELQLEGKKRMTIEEFLRGIRL